MKNAARLHLVVFSVVFMFGAVHLIAVIRRAILRGDSFQYDFRFYSLLLLGVCLVVPSILALRQVRELHRGLPQARRRALQICALMLLVTLPIIPSELHTFPYTSLEAAGGMVAFGTVVSLLAAADSCGLLLAQSTGPAD